MPPLPKFKGYVVGRFCNLSGDAPASPVWKALMGFLALNTGGDAVGVFLQSVWWHSHYPSWKVRRPVPALKFGEFQLR